MKNKISGISIFLTIMLTAPLFVFLYFFHIDSYNPVNVPISIINSQNFSYDFQVPASISYEVGLQFKRNVDFGRINTLVRDSALVESVLLEDGSEFGYPVNNHSGGFEYFLINWGGFDAKRGHKYTLKIRFQKSLPYTNKSDPRLIVSPAISEGRGFFLLALAFLGILCLFMQILRVIFFFRKKTTRINNALSL